MSNEQAHEVVDALEEKGWDVRTDYSGRGMDGKTCVAVVLGSERELFTVGACLADFDLRNPDLDDLALGVVAYWPSLKTDGE